MSTSINNMQSSDHFPEFDMSEKPLPKGILKNSNPNATYHKHHHRRKLEELVDQQQNNSDLISTHTHHGRHRHHHKHHRHHSDQESDQEKNEKNRKHHGSSNSSSGGSSSSSSSKKKHHKHHHRHHRNATDEVASDTTSNGTSDHIVEVADNTSSNADQHQHRSNNSHHHRTSRTSDRRNNGGGGGGTNERSSKNGTGERCKKGKNRVIGTNSSTSDYNTPQQPNTLVVSSNISNHQHHEITTNEVKNEHNNDEDDDEMGGDFNVCDADVDDILNIYDCPKVPPIPVVVLMNSNDQKHTRCEKMKTAADNNFNEALQQQLQQNNLNSVEVVYDVPRSNPRKVENSNPKPKEAIYVNDSFSEHLQKNYHADSSEATTTVITNNNADGTYDIPRNVNNEQHLEDLIPVAYDVPKIRDSLSTIEEEHQEYDIPRNVNHALKNFDTDDSDPLVNNSEENLYENQAYQDKKEDNIYANDSVAHITALSELSVSSSTHTDDSRSSGYRSSSSPSIQSEELYVNESAIGSMEESPTNSSPDIMSTLPHLKEIGVGTTESLPKDNTKKKSKKDKKDKEAKREKERLQAEAVEREVLSKKSLERPKSKAPKPPKTYFTDSHANPVKIELPSVNTEERKKRLFEALDQKEQPRIQNDEPSNQDKKDHPKEQTISKSTPLAPPPPEETKKSNIKKNKDNVAVGHQPKKQIEFKEPRLPKEKPVFTSTKKDEKLNKTPSPQVAKKVPSPQISKQNRFNQVQDTKDQGTLDKKPSQKDRSVDVYHETVRQRATRNSEAIKEVFADVQEENTTNTQHTSIKKPNRKKNRAPQNPQKDINDEDLPSVKELRSKFENEKSKNSGATNNNNSNSNNTANTDSILPASKKSAFKASKIDFKKGFNVMSSLTRRSAMSVSKSMQNLHVDQSAVVPASADDNKKVEEMEFSHFTYSDTEINHKEQKHQDDENEVSSHTKKKVTSGGSSSSGKKKQESTKKEVEHYEYRKPSPTEDYETSAATDHQELVDPDPVYVNVESTKKPTRQQEQQPSDSAADENHPNNGVQVQLRSRNGGESSAANKLLQSLETDEEEGNQTGLGPWNPIKIVAHLYKVEEIKPLAKNGEGGGTNNHHLNHELEGYIERLPPGKKKSTIWNSWKRQYFVAKAGLLLIFGDSSRTVLMDRIELFGGRVDYMESTMLGIQDRRGHYVVLRFKDNEDADKWHSGLSNHVSHDLAQTFVTPVINSNPDLFKNILIIDFGGSSVRAGIASSMPTLPQLFFPSVMAIGKGHEDEKYFGMDAFAPEIRSRCNLVHPFAPSSNIDKYTVNQIALQGFLEKIFRDLNIDPSEYEVQLVSPRPLNEKTQKQLVNLLFDDFGVKAVNMSHQSILAMYAYNAHTGVVVDLGERMDIVPIVDGYRVTAGVSRSPVGGPQMRQKLQHYLLGRNYSLTTFVDSYVVRSAIENLSYMSRNFDRELERYRKKPEKIDCILELGKSSKLEMGSERFESVEGLFKPELWGLDQAGVHVLVHKAIRECSMDVRKEITQSIFLAGGLSLIPGLRERLELELEKLSPATKPRVHASPYRYHASFLGATVHATSAAFKSSRLTREAWMGSGQRLNQPWNLS